MKILVTGGGGFLGQAIVRQLLDRGEEVSVLNRGRYPELEALSVTCHRGDIADGPAVSAACASTDAVIHVAAKAGPGLFRPDFERANVQGTDNVIAACRAHGIRTLVFTSSPSVTHRFEDLEGGDESAPYPDRFPAPYPATKAESEKRVLAADGGELRTCALRPRLIWGPGDNQLLPRVVEMNRRGRLRLPTPEARIDTTYIDNAAHAHLLALDNLRGPATAAGKAYFISNGEPRAVSDIIGSLLRAAGETPRLRTVNLKVAMAAARVAEGIWKLLRLKSDPPLSRFVLEQLAVSHWYDLSAARRDLGYEPRVSIDEGLERLRGSRTGG